MGRSPIKVYGMRQLRLMGFGPQIAFGGSDDGGGGGGGDGGRERGRTPDPVAVATPDPEPVVEESSWSNSVFNPSNWFSGDDDDPAPAPAPDPEPDPDPTPNSSMSMADQYASYGAGKIAPTPTPETNAERVVRETTEKLVETGQISPEQTTPAMTQGAVDLLNATGVPSSDTNPLLTDTMGIGSDGRLLDAVTGATDAGVIIDTIGTPTVEAKSPTLAQTFKDEDEDDEQGVLSGLLQLLGGAAVEGTGAAIEGTSGAVKSAVDQPRYKYGDSSIPLKPEEIQGNKTVTDIMAPGVGTAFNLAKGITDFLGFTEPAAPTVTGKVDYGFMPRNESGGLAADPNLVFTVPSETNFISKNILDPAGAAVKDLGGNIKSSITGPVAENLTQPIFGTKDDGSTDYTDIDLGALGTKLVDTAGQLAPAIGTAIATRNPRALLPITAAQTIADVGDQTEANVRAQLANSGASENQIQAAVQIAKDKTVLPAAGVGVAEGAPFLGGFGGSLARRALMSSGTSGVSEGLLEPSLAATAANKGRATGAVDPEGALLAGIIGGVGGAAVPTRTDTATTLAKDGPTSSGGVASIPLPQPLGPSGTGLTAAQRTALSDVGTAEQTSVEPFISEGVALDPQSTIDTVGRGPTTQKQDGTVEDAIFTDIPVNPNVQTTAPAQIAPPEVTTSAPNIITGQTTSTTRGAPPDLSQPTTGSLPAFDISAVGQPQVQSTAPQSITIPGTNVTVDVPALTTQQSRPDVPAIPTGLASLGTGGVFTPNLAPGSTVSAAQPAVDTTSQTQSVNETIAQEVAREGGLSIETAQRLARENNLSVQEVANLAENAMGVDTSTATGPSTALTTPTETGVASTDRTTTETEPFVSEGVILDPEGAVVTTEPLPAIDDTIEGTFTEPSTEVDISRRRTNVPVTTDTVVEVAPETTPETTRKTVFGENLGVTVPTEDDDGGVTVEVDEEEDVPADGEDVVVEFGSTFDDDDSDDDVAVEEDAPFECPDGFEAVKVDGGWRCQMTGEAPEKVRPTAGAYYRPTQNPNYGAAARRRRA